MALQGDPQQGWALAVDKLAQLVKQFQTVVVELKQSNLAARVMETASTLHEETRDKLMPEPKFHHNIIFGVFTGIVLTSVRLMAKVRRKREMRRLRSRQKVKPVSGLAQPSFLESARKQFVTLGKDPKVSFCQR